MTNLMLKNLLVLRASLMAEKHHAMVLFGVFCFEICLVVAFVVGVVVVGIADRSLDGILVG